MVAEARHRAEKYGWDNVTVIQGAAEEVKPPGKFDGLLLFALHDVLTSPTALDNILACLKAGGRVVSVGPKLAPAWPGRILNPMESWSIASLPSPARIKTAPGVSWQSACLSFRWRNTDQA
jgi:hypothetical protein